MKVMHIHVAVNDLTESVGFYSTIFGSTPTLERTDYAKWILDDPKVNFAISIRGGQCGMNHMGIPVETEEELQEIAERLETAEIKYSKQEGTSCCHSHSNKHWALDPQEIAWETFHTLDHVPVFGSDLDTSTEESSSCCIPLDIGQKNAEESFCCIPNENDATGCCK